MNKAKGRKAWSDEKLVARALSAKTHKAYRDNLSELRGRASASLYERCAALAESEIPAERTLGVDIVSQLYRSNKRKKYGVEFPYRKEALTMLLAMLVVEKDTNTIIALLYGIGNNSRYIKSKEISLITKFIASEDNDIRFASVAALTGIEKMQAIRGLIALSKDKCSHIRDWATFGLGTISDLDNDAIREALYERCADRHHDTRMEAIFGLAKRKDDRVKKYLEEAFDDCTVYVLESIRELKAEEYLPRLEAMLEETEQDPDVSTYWLGHLKECIATLRNGS